MANPSSEIDRRRFVQASGVAVGTLASLPGVTVADSDHSAEDLKRGRHTVIDAKITHPNADKAINRVVSGGGVRRTLADNSKLFVITAPIVQIVGEHRTLLRTPLTFTRFGASGSYEQQDLYARTTYDGTGSPRHLAPSVGYNPFKLGVELDGQTAVITRADTEVLKVPVDDLKRTTLPTREVTIPQYGEPEEKEIERPGIEGTTTVRPKVGTRTVSVTPKLSVRNSGRLTVFGHKSALVVPQTNGSVVDYIIEGAQTNADLEVEPVEDAEMLLIHNHPAKLTGGDA